MSIGSDPITQLLFFAVKLIPLVFVSAVVVNFLIEVGVAERTSRIIIPLLRACHLPDKLSVPFVAVSLEPRMGHAMLASMLERDAIKEREVIIVTLVTTPLVILLFFVPRYYIPVAFPALGSTVATLFLVSTFITSSVKLVVGMIYGKVTSRGAGPLVGKSAPRASPRSARRVSKRGVLKAALGEAAALTKKVAVKTLIVIAFLAVAIYFGAFELLEKALKGLIGFTGLPAQSATIAAAYAVSSPAGMLLAGAMLAQAEITCKEALLGLLLGSALFKLSSEYPKHSFPFYASIYHVRIAFKLVTISIAIELLVLTALIIAVSIFM